ncbi:unnamed protein product [Rotaria sp. Silwood1]|nr:unnamed protein product [Rotaria sp. Silwood1]CAF1619937.1 unnamed protein product [Rotaria sp. Silwood1]CAF3722828.1 unnamed protein product [Rotaria sp. Silwood1]CAF3747971.1 unnamed protein product [Rotaria sp. Silwood1]CAF3764502.1 unnamed protein product [Rotaria sp. Silwood1]
MNGFLAALPYIVLWLNINISGIIADVIIRKNLLTTTNTRKLFNILGNLFPAIFVLGLAFMTCRLKYVAVVLLTIGVAFHGGYLLVANDIAPAYTGIVFGISNTLSTIPGIVSSYAVGALTEKDPSNWRIVVFICAAIYIIGMIAFTFLGSSELQPWARTSIAARVSFENPLSNMSNEVFLEIFEYLDDCDIMKAFLNFNIRFRYLMTDSSLLLKIKLCSEIKSNS